jgi:hypothetical protein
MGAGAQPEFFSIVRNQVLLLGIFVSLFGTLILEWYYSSFGLHYELLNIPFQHVIFRGGSAIFHSPCVALAYLLAVVGAILGDYKLGLYLWCLRLNSKLMSVGLLAVSVAIGWPAASYFGRQEAKKDMGPQSSLPTLVRLHFARDASPQAFLESYFAAGSTRVVLDSGRDVVLVNLVPDVGSEIPAVVHLNLGDGDVLISSSAH